MLYDNLSFVIQGILDRRTTALTASIVQHFPGAEIIQSTNIENAQAQGICDKLIITDNPPELSGENNKHLNRLITTSFKGIEAASNPLVIKLRSDLFFTNDHLYHTWYKYLEIYERQFGQEFRIFNIPVGIVNYYTIDPRSSGSLALPYHPSDWLMIGQKKDILEYYRIPFKDAEKVYDTGGRHTSRIEQYPAITNLQAHGFSVPFSHEFDASEINIQNTLRFFVNNFIVFNLDHAGIFSQKYRMPTTAPILFDWDKWQYFSNFFYQQRLDGL